MIRHVAGLNITFSRSKNIFVLNCAANILHYFFSTQLITSKSFIKPYDLRFNEVDKPKGPPYVLDRPGALSFNAGPLR